MSEVAEPGAIKPVVAGYDTSEESEVALRWAARAADRRGARLIVVHGTGWEHPQRTPQQAGVAATAKRAAQEIAERGAARARELVPGLDVEAVGVISGADKALQDYSRDADLVVIGNRGRGNLRSALLGSVAFAVSAHALCPVVVVRAVDSPSLSTAHPVVVGVDGSEHSDIALDHAGQVAVETGAALRIVVAWTSPSGNPWSVAHSSEHAKSEPAAAVSENPWDLVYETEAGTKTTIAEEAPRSAAEIARRAVQRAESRHPELRVEQVVAAGRPEHVIVQAGVDAAAGLVVVGARGRGDLGSLLLGSVSRAVIQRAESAVLVVR